jgi:hypothetical protein
VYRGTSFDKDLAERMVDAIRHPGFGLLDIWELCTAYFVPMNKLGRKGLDTTIDRLGFEQGVLYEREVVEYSAAYREAAAGLGERRTPTPIPVEFASDLESSKSIVVAGSAGAKVRSAARLVAEAGMRSGLWATLRGDYPVTVKTGHSVTSVILSPVEIPPVAIGVPDLLVLVSEDGLKKVGGMLAGMGPEQSVVTLPQFAEVETEARVVVVDPKDWDGRIPKVQLSLMLLTVSSIQTGLIPTGALRAAATGPFEIENLNAIEAGVGLAG